MALDTKLSKEQIVENLKLLESTLSKYGEKEQTIDTTLIAQPNNPTLFSITRLTYNLEGEEYTGTLKDRIRQISYPTNPHSESLTTFREIIINHDNKHVLSAAHSLGGYERKRILFIPSFKQIEPEEWQIGYEGTAFDTNMHLDRALCEFQNQLRYRL